MCFPFLGLLSGQAFLGFPQVTFGERFGGVLGVCCLLGAKVFEQLLVPGTLEVFFQVLKWSFNILLKGVFPDADWTGAKQFGCIAGHFQN